MMNKDSRIIQEITAIVDSMGFWDDQEKVYKINSDTCECLKEILRLLRKDGSSFPVLRHLGKINIVEKDLIPIIKGYCLTDEALAGYTVRLLVVLTYPALVFFKEKVPNDVDQKRTFFQLNSFLRTYKTVFSQHKDVWEILCKKAAIIIKKDPLDQTEEEKILLERIFILIRNILHVPKDTLIDVADEDEMITEDLIVSLKTSGTLDFILQFTSDTVSHQFCFHLLEIIYSLLRGQCPEFLAFDESQGQHATKKCKSSANSVESKELEELKEREKRFSNFAKSSRFNRFKDSTYTVKNVKSIGENDLIYHKTTDDPHKISLDKEKTSTRRPKNKALMADNFTTWSSASGIAFRRPSMKVQVILKEFCENFIKESYNPLMAYVKSALENKNAQENDETYYFFAAYFFMEFNRIAERDPSSIEETFNFEYFHYLHSRIVTCTENIANARADREVIQAYSRRCHTSLKAYKELFYTIASMKNVQDENMLSISKEILDKAFLELDYRELLLTLLSNYDEQKMSPQFLKDLIETNHVFLKMFEHFTNSNLDHLEFFVRYSNSKVIRSYLLALHRFEFNTEKLNHAIIRMFHRIACECKSPVLFFQLSIFRVFQRCFEFSKVDKGNKLVEIVNFARYIIREFVKLAKENDKLLVETLFWKSKSDMCSIESNYAEPEPKKTRKRRKKKNGTISDSDKSDQSEDEREKEIGIDDQLGDLSNDSGEGFIPVLSSTQNVQPDRSDIPERPEIPEMSSINAQSEGNSQTFGINGSELPCESELLSVFGAGNDDDDDDLLDLDEVLDHVADDQDEMPTLSQDDNQLNEVPMLSQDDNQLDEIPMLSQNDDQLNETLIENPVNNISDVLNDDDSMEGEVTIVKRKKKVIFEESDEDE